MLAVLAVPTGLRAQETPTAWNPAPESDIAGYTIFIGTSPDSLSPIETVTEKGSTSFLDRLAPGTTYYCSVQAFSNTGLTSEMSAQFSFTTPSEAASAAEIAVKNSAGSEMLSNVDPISFGSVDLGSASRTETITITNSGIHNLTGLALTLDGPNSSEFMVSSLGATVLAPGTSTTFEVRLVPTATGTRSASIRIASNDADENPFVIPLAGQGTDPATVASPDIAILRADGTDLTHGSTNLTFGSLNLGAAGTSQILTIKNSGTALLSGLALSVTGSHAADFTVSALSAVSLAPNASMTFSVTFKPGAAGSRSAALRIASNDADENPFDIALAGTGVTVAEIAVEKADGTNLVDGSASLAFGSLNLGATSAGQTITIRNPGTGVLTGLALTVTGSHASDFTVSSLAATTLAPGASMTFSVAFKPGAAGSRSASLQIASNDVDENPFDIALAGTGITIAEIAVEKADGTNLVDGSASLGFGALNLGATSAGQTITIRNPGTGVLTGLALTVTGSHASDFTVSSLAATTLAPGASTTFSVTFKPGAAGSRSASLQIASNDADENPFDITLSGTGVTVAEIAVEKADGTNLVDGGATIPFGSLVLGAPGISQSITIRNSGNAVLSGLALTVTGTHPSDFTVSSLSSSSLAQGASTSFTITFKPGAAGLRRAELQIASNDADENPFDISLTGFGGIAPEIAVENAAGNDLTSGSAHESFSGLTLQAPGVTRTFTIRNLGSAALSGLSHAITGSHASDFTATSFAAASLAPGASTTVNVTFTPSAAGARSATLSITSNDADENPFLITLTGNGVAVPDIDVTRNDASELAGGAPANFGKVEIGDSGTVVSFTIHNRGTADLTDLAISTPGSHGADFIVTGPDTTKLAPSATTTFSVVFKPKAAGKRTATLRINSNDADENPFDIPLSGIAVAIPKIEISADRDEPLANGKAVAAFGSANTGTTGTEKTFTIRNTGSAELTGLKILRRGDHKSDFDVSALRREKLAPGASTTFKVAFRPSDAGNRSAALSITSNDADQGEFRISLTGYGRAVPDIEIKVAGGAVLTDEDAFVKFGGSNKTRIFTITNRGTANLTGLSIALSGLHVTDFRNTRIKDKTLAPGKSTTFKVRFAPHSGGTRWGAAKISSNDPDTGTFDIVLTGGSSSSSKSAAVTKSAPAPGSPAIAALPPENRVCPDISVVLIDGQKYRCITIAKTAGTDPNPGAVEVSSDLVEWSSGARHTTVIKDNASVLKVRDNTPLKPGSKRFIRLKPAAKRIHGLDH